LYVAAPTTAADMQMILPWALSILLLQVAGMIFVALHMFRGRTDYSFHVMLLQLQRLLSPES
jgi:hypothetical protein